MESIHYTLAGIGLYFGADWLLNQIERYRETRFAQRQVVLFVIILIVALVSFELMQRLLKP